MKIEEKIPIEKQFPAFPSVMDMNQICDILPHRDLIVESVLPDAAIWEDLMQQDANLSLNLESGMLIAVPIPEEHATSSNLIESAIQRALVEAEVRTKGVTTPHTICHGRVVQDDEKIVWVDEVLKPEAPIYNGLQNGLSNLCEIVDGMLVIWGTKQIRYL